MLSQLNSVSSFCTTPHNWSVLATRNYSLLLYLGRGGSEGCSDPQPVEKLTGMGVVQVECGAQFSLALTKAGEVWTW